MNYYELAIDDEGEPFELPLTAAGWRVKRLARNGGGRPRLLRWPRGHHEHGLPMVIPLDSSYSDLLEAAGRGRYRLEPVGPDRKAIEGAPVASTGILGGDEDLDEARDLDDDEIEDGDRIEGRRVRVERKGTGRDRVLERLLECNARMTAAALQQTTAVMSGAAQLVSAAHGAGLTNRPALPAPPIVVTRVGEVMEAGADDDDQDAELEGPLVEEAEEATPSDMLRELVQMLVKETMGALIPVVVEKLSKTGKIGGLPLEALIDWRKAVPPQAPEVGSVPHAPSAWPGSPPPAPPTTPQPHVYTQAAGPPPVASTSNMYAHGPARPAPGYASVAFVPPSWSAGAAAPRSAAPTAPTPVAPAAMGSAEAPQVAQTFETPPEAVATAAPSVAGPAPAMVVAPPTAVLAAVANDVAVSADAGAASLGLVPVEAAPAEMAPAGTPGGASHAIDAHFMRVWSALDPPDQLRAASLLAKLPPEARAAAIAELSLLPFDQAVARARYIINGRRPSTS